MSNNETIFREAFIAIRDLSAHIGTCVQCIQMCSGGPICPVYKDTTEKCLRANDVLAFPKVIGAGGSLVGECERRNGAWYCYRHPAWEPMVWNAALRRYECQSGWEGTGNGREDLEPCDVTMVVRR